MEHRNVHHLAQALLDDEAIRRLDVLEIDAAEARAEKAHAIDEFLDVLGVDLEIDAVDVGEALEQHRLALHHRLRRQRAEIAEAEHRRAVGNHRHHVARRCSHRPWRDRARSAGRERRRPANRPATDRAAW